MSRMIQMSEAPIDFELIRQEFIAKYRKLLDDRGLDAVFVTRIENVASLTRFRAPFGRFHYVMRYALREEPIRRSPRVRAVHPAPPDPLPARDPRTPIDDWNDGLPWPLSPPDPPAR